MAQHRAGLRWRLREETRETHKRLDYQVSALDIATRAGLEAFLTGNALAHRALIPFDFEFDGHMARRMALIERDLDTLGVSHAAKTPSVTAPSEASAPGFRYVIAGSAMGGRVLLRRHGASADESLHDADHLLSDPRLDEYWEEVQAELTKLPETGPAADAVIAGANACFALFAAAFEAAAPGLPAIAAE
ncbi:MAG: biliverdin-producing heme oxygenase [Pseudomonadota bacterium]